MTYKWTDARQNGIYLLNRASFPRPKGPPKLRYMERLYSVKAETGKWEERKGETKKIYSAVIKPTPCSPYLGSRVMLLLATKTPCVTAVSPRFTVLRGAELWNDRSKPDRLHLVSYFAPSGAIYTCKILVDSLKLRGEFYHFQAPAVQRMDSVIQSYRPLLSK